MAEAMALRFKTEQRYNLLPENQDQDLIRGRSSRVVYGTALREKIS